MRGFSLALWPALALLALYGVIYVQFAVQLVGYPFDLDQGEGYDAWAAWIIRQRQLPYTDNQAFPYHSSNYPPVWGALAGLPMSRVGPGLAPPRIFSSLAALLAALAIAVAAHRRARASGAAPLLAAVVAGGLFLASPYVFHTTPLARVNSLTLLFSVVAISLFESPGRVRVGVGVLALLAALYTKPTAVDAAAACIAFSAIGDPRRGVAAALSLGALGLALLFALQVATGGAFWLNVVSGNLNPFDAAQLGAYWTNFGEVHPVLVGLAAAEATIAIRARAWSPWLLYLLTASAMAIGAGKLGAGESYFLGVIAAAAVLGGTLVARLATAQLPSPNATAALASRPGSSYALGAVLLAQGLLFSHGALAEALPWLPDRGFQATILGRAPSAQDRAAGEEIADLLRRVPGPVLVEDPSFAVAAGKPVVGNATHLRNLHEAGLWDPTGLAGEIADRRFGAVVLNAQLYPAPVLAAIGRYYYLHDVVEVGRVRYQLFLPGGT